MPIFRKNMNIQAPWKFLKMKTLPLVPKILIWTSKIIPDLQLSAVFCPIKKIKSLHPNPQPSGQTLCGNCGTGISLSLYLQIAQISVIFSFDIYKGSSLCPVVPLFWLLTIRAITRSQLIRAVLDGAAWRRIPPFAESENRKSKID